MRPRSSTSNRYPALLLLLTIGLAAVSGCGYHNPYLAGSPEGTGEPVRLYTSIWPNRTSEAGLESLIFRTTNGWFKKSGMVTLAANPAEADLVLEGEIVGIDLPALSYGRHEEASEARLVLILNLALRRADDRTVLWQENRLAMDDAYHIAAGAETTRANQRQALTRIAEDLAERIYLKTLAARQEMVSGDR